jgi:hypothetical protein
VQVGKQPDDSIQKRAAPPTLGMISGKSRPGRHNPHLREYAAVTQEYTKFAVRWLAKDV